MSIYLNEIYSHTLKFFEDRKYKLVKSKNTFEKKQGDFKFKIRLLSHTRSTETAIEMFAYIEHIPTAKIYKKATGFTLLSTIGNEIGMIENNDDNKINNSFYHDIIMLSEDEIPDASKEIMILFDTVAEPYFEKYGNLETVDKVLNDNPDVISVHRNDQYNRYSLGLIVAKLNNRKNYESLEKKYDKLIKEMSEMYIERYSQVKVSISEL